MEWTRPSWQLTVTAFVAGERGNDRVVGRYTLRNLTDAPLSLRLALVVRPLQVNPPTQLLATPGGVSPIRMMEWDGRVMSAGARRIFPLQRPDMAGVSSFDGGAYPQRLMRTDAAGKRELEDETGLASGVLAYDVVLPPRGVRRLGIVAPLTGDAPELPRTAPDSWLDEEEARVAAFWRKELSATRVEAAEGGREVTNALRTSLAHMLIMQDGPILRPGARSYVVLHAPLRQRQGPLLRRCARSRSRAGERQSRRVHPPCCGGLALHRRPRPASVRLAEGEGGGAVHESAAPLRTRADPSRHAGAAQPLWTDAAFHFA